MRARGATSVYGALGPCIHAECYEFSEPELQLVVDVLGEGVRSRTADGRAALDVPTAVAAAMVAGGVTQVPGVDACTGCGGGYFSHRARRDEGRQAMVVWSTGTEIR
jgi:copper oxidase (laccase) domain-containing protein